MQIQIGSGQVMKGGPLSYLTIKKPSLPKWSPCPPVQDAWIESENKALAQISIGIGTVGTLAALPDYRLI